MRERIENYFIGGKGWRTTLYEAKDKELLYMRQRIENYFI